MPKKKIVNKPKTQKLSQAEFEKKVIELSKKGSSAEKIGESMRREGIHAQEHAKISRVLKAKENYSPPELKNIQEKFERIVKHLEKNKQDKRAMREKDRIFASLRKIKKYHKI